jgi:hypothetical protein
MDGSFAYPVGNGHWTSVGLRRELNPRYRGRDFRAGNEERDMFGISERRARDQQARLLREVRMLLGQRLAACTRAADPRAADGRLGEMLEEVVICGQVLAQVGSLAPSELDHLDRIRRNLLAEKGRRL